ncbi:nuclease-related domain-containing protein [Quadrisphaera sp. INWT6]|uniref:nuclease-related domain-containing protein n=1 Tax=Quadrisphaera sp. INWT6 TaxID=2596917 RepID=UPI001892661B|nr:nuclease-related domain-containing protein [Quadrisphaera sp. INWT6]MBF5082142.1 NERD domain-containing protein [Quadrisphaera sp. INWT6]
MLLSLLDGSVLRRIGRNVEADVGDELRRARGVFGVVSSLMFENTDVDHVVLALDGVWVVEVKWAMTPSHDLQHL